MTIESVKEEINKRRKNKTHPLVKEKTKRKLVNKLTILLLLVLGVIIGIKTNEDFKQFVKVKVFEETFPFSKINSLYQKYFGTSLPFEGVLKNDTETVFKEKLSYSKKEKYQDGLKLTVSKEYLAPVLESGMVVFIGDKENYGKTVIIQQIDGIDVWYSNMDNINVNLYDYIEKGTLIGSVKESSLILLFKKDGKILDYENKI